MQEPNEESSPFCPDCGERETTDGELCERCARDREWTAWLIDTLRAVLALCDEHGWHDCEGADALRFELGEAERETQRPQSLYELLERGDEQITLRISDHHRNVQRGGRDDPEHRIVGQIVSLCTQPSGGEITLAQLSQMMAVPCSTEG